MLFANIPHELKVLEQWIVYKSVPKPNGKTDKPPYNARTSQLADPTKRADYSDFNTAVNAVLRHGFDGIGFCFTRDDPYCGVDLDECKNPDGTIDEGAFEAQKKIYQAFNSYTEFSPSGNGIHIIGKAFVPQGRKRRHVEIYSHDRFFTFTGNVLHDAPIRDVQNLAMTLYQELGGAKEQIEVREQPITEDDEAVLERARNAANGDKFRDLEAGNWQAYYSSQSEADYAFIDIVGFHCRNIEQTRRIFLASVLGQRPKAQLRPNYVTAMAVKSFDNLLPTVDLGDAIKNSALAVVPPRSFPADDAGAPKTVAEHPLPAPPHDLVSLDIWRQPPPGLVGQVAEFVYRRAPRPFYEAAITAALGYTAGAAARQFNVSGKGLNLYLCLFADSGTGKEAMKSGTAALTKELETQYPVAKHIIGTNDFPSGQGALRALHDAPTPCFTGFLGEFGRKLKEMTSDKSSSALSTLGRVLLDIYEKSGASDTFLPTPYSDRAKTLDTIYSPNLSLIAETVPEEFFEAVNEGSFSGGLIPRFIFTSYDSGYRVPLNEEGYLVQPSAQLLSDFGALIMAVQSLAQRGTVMNIEFDADAREFARTIDKTLDARINSTQSRITRPIWNRTYVHVLKVAGLLAVGVNCYQPVITRYMLEWALSLVLYGTHKLIARADAGDFGMDASEQKRMNEIIRLTREYFTKDPGQLQGGYNIRGIADMHKKGVIPHSYYVIRAVRLKAFKDARDGALKNTLAEMVRAGMLGRVKPSDLAQFNFTGEAYAVTNHGILD